MNNSESIAAKLFIANHGFVKGLAIKYAPWPGLSEDIVQQVFVEFVSKEDQWDLNSEIKPLLATMTRYVALRYWRERTHKLPEVVEQLAEHVRQLAEEREKEPRYDDELGALRRCLDKLPIKSRAFVSLYYYSGVSTAEIAVQMKMKSDTVCRALGRLREKLRNCLDRAISEGQTYV